MYPGLRSLSFAALLIVLPFSGIRVICIAPAPAAGDPAAAPEAEAAEKTLTDCERLCPFHPPGPVEALHADEQSSPDDDADCALSSDAAALQMLGTVAVLRSPIPLAVPQTVTDASVVPSSVYSDPALTLLAPPPKSSVL